MKGLLGGKGAGLAEMSSIGLPVPPGFTITAQICQDYYKNNNKYPKELKGQIAANIKQLEKVTGKRLGDKSNPLLVSVRSGAAVSMPGMMDTILNLGLNDAAVEGLAALTGNPRFAWDSYRRFIQMFGDVAMGVAHSAFEHQLEEVKRTIAKRKGIADADSLVQEALNKKVPDTTLEVNDLKDLVVRYKTIYKQHTHKDFPQASLKQLMLAINAVFGSWNNDRAIAYREINNIKGLLGTAVNVQVMVFGNMQPNSGTGVAFTRDPATGEKRFYGEYLMNAQGEDVVAGIRTPHPINIAQKGESNLTSLEEEMPEIYQQLEEIARKLDAHYRDMQDIEFTIQKGKLWMIQTRVGKRTGFAAFKMAVDMVREGLITKEEALLRVEPEQLNQLLRPIFDPREKQKALQQGKLLAKGLNAGPGAATGKVVFNAPDAEEWAGRGEEVLLVRIETSPEDIRGMSAAQGILTARGGMTSHAALVGRQMGKVCVVGCDAHRIDYRRREMVVKEETVKEGDYLSIDGSTGEVILGKTKTVPSEVLQVVEGKLKAEESSVYRDYADMMSWADEARRLGVRTNADLPDQAKTAVAFGAEGIGLCRTEHMFFEGERIDFVREMILAEDKVGREKALSRLLPFQREDFLGLFRVMDGMPVIIRTLDPPLHEFLPGTPAEIKILAKQMRVPATKLTQKIDSLKEQNPMLGLRGCRLGIVFPDIYEMQVRAIIEAACKRSEEHTSELQSH